MQAHATLRVVALVRDVEWERHIRDTLGRSCIIRWIRDSAELDRASGLTSANVFLWHLELGVRVTAVMMATVRRSRFGDREYHTLLCVLPRY
jgi:hypothetical protein